jgi:hypothetical protein
MSVTVSKKSVHCEVHHDKIPAGTPIFVFIGYNKRENYCQQAVEEILTEMKARCLNQ